MPSKTKIEFIEAFAIAGTLGWLVWGYFWMTQTMNPEVRMVGMIQLIIGTVLMTLWGVSRFAVYFKEIDNIVADNITEIFLFVVGTYLLLFQSQTVTNFAIAILLLVLGVIGLASERD